jgi:hypothetical protein
LREQDSQNMTTRSENRSFVEPESEEHETFGRSRSRMRLRLRAPALGLKNFLLKGCVQGN